MTDEVSPVKAVLEVNDALVIKVPKEPVFLQGLSLEVKIPPEVAEFRDSVAYVLYTDVKPQPTEKTIDYQGNRIFINTFPTRLSCNLLIPLVDSVELKETPYSTVLPSSTTFTINSSPNISSKITLNVGFFSSFGTLHEPIKVIHMIAKINNNFLIILFSYPFYIIITKK
jgi:hypothetical protein